MNLGLFARHVDRWLSAYCEGVLPAAQASQVAAHVLACQRCHRELALVRTGTQLAAQLRPNPNLTPTELPAWSDLAPLLDQESPARAPFLRWAPVFALVVVVMGGLLWHGAGAPASHAAASPPSLEEVALAAHRGATPLSADERVVRRWVAGQPVTLLETGARGPLTASAPKQVSYRTIDDLQVATWSRSDRQYVLVSRLTGEAACTICHTVL
jgi:anti-sigma factor RsiW